MIDDCAIRISWNNYISIAQRQFTKIIKQLWNVRIRFAVREKTHRLSSLDCLKSAVFGNGFIGLGNTGMPTDNDSMSTTRFSKTIALLVRTEIYRNCTSASVMLVFRLQPVSVATIEYRFNFPQIDGVSFKVSSDVAASAVDDYCSSFIKTTTIKGGSGMNLMMLRAEIHNLRMVMIFTHLEMTVDKTKLTGQPGIDIVS